MKYLLLLLLPFNLQAQVTCGLTTYEEVDACTVEDKLPLLFGRLYTSHTYTTELQYIQVDPCDPETVDVEATEEVEVCPPWDQKTGKYYYEKQEFDDEGTPELSMYERLVMLNKPDLSVFTSELASWAASVKLLIDWRNRVDAITRLRRAMGKCGYVASNLSLFKSSLTVDDPRVICMESKKAELDVEDVQQAAKDKRHKDIAFGVSLIEDVLLLIPNDMDPTNKLALLDYIAKIERLLRLGDIDGTKGLTEATPVTAIFSAQLKGYLVMRMTAYLGE